MSSPAVASPRRQLSGRPADTVTALVAAAVEEVAVTGFDGLTVRNVARRAGVSPATAYTYFASKEHLLTEVFWRRLSALEEPAGRQLGDRLSTESRPRRATWRCSWQTNRSWPRRSRPRCSPTTPMSRCCATRSAPPSSRAWGRRSAGRLTPRCCEPSPSRSSALLLSAGMGYAAYADLPELMADATALIVRRSDDDRGRVAPTFDPYDYAIHEDPYPTYAALRAEAPVYYNEQHDFWALSRHADVGHAFRDFERFSSSRRRLARPGSDRAAGARTSCRSWRWTRLGTAHATAGVEGVHAEAGARSRAAGPCDHRRAPRAGARARRRSTSSTTSPARSRWTSSPSCWACPPPTVPSCAGSPTCVVHREDGVLRRPCRGRAGVAGAGGVLPRADRRATSRAARRPDIGPAGRGRDRRRTAQRRRDRRRSCS